MLKIRNIFSSKENKERRNNKAFIRKLHKKVKRWDDGYSEVIVAYMKFIVRLYRNLNHGSIGYESTLKIFKELEQELRQFYLNYDKIEYDYMDLHLFCNQDFVKVSKNVKTTLCFGELDTEVSFLPMSFLAEASKIHVLEGELGAYDLDEYLVTTETTCSRNCRLNQIREKLNILYSSTNDRLSENDLILRKVAELSGEIDGYIKITKEWEKRKREVEKRYRNYCQERYNFLTQGTPTIFENKIVQ